MDKTKLVQEVANLFRLTGHKVDISVKINHREIDVRAEETQSLLRKVILIECADYQTSVGVAKLQEDVTKLRSAQEQLKDKAVIMHVSSSGYSPDASGYAHDQGIAIFTLDDLLNQLVNFDAYIASILSDPQRPVILKEYQPTLMHYDGDPKHSAPAIDFIKVWINSTNRHLLTVLGDYGVGKSWLLKRLLYDLVDRYRENPQTEPLHSSYLSRDSPRHLTSRI